MRCNNVILERYVPNPGEVNRNCSDGPFVRDGVARTMATQNGCGGFYAPDLLNPAPGVPTNPRDRADKIDQIKLYCDYFYRPVYGHNPVGQICDGEPHFVEHAKPFPQGSIYNKPSYGYKGAWSCRGRSYCLR